MTVTKDDIQVLVVQTLNQEVDHHDVDAIVRELMARYDLVGDAPTVDFENIKDFWAIVARHRTGPVSTHWHAARIAIPGCVTELFAGDTIYAALEYAAAELNSLAGWLHDGVTVAGDAGLLRLAYSRFQLASTYWDLAAEAEEVVTHYHHHSQGATGAELLDAARHVVDGINVGTPEGFAVYECVLDECAPTEED